MRDPVDLRAFGFGRRMDAARMVAALAVCVLSPLGCDDGDPDPVVTSGSTTTASASTTAGSGGGGGAGECTSGTEEPCYSGPAGTEDVGECRAGTRVCGQDGVFSACDGERTPAAEDCSTDADEDCGGDVPECGAALWAITFGYPGWDTTYAVHTDVNGDILAIVYGTGVAIDNTALANGANLIKLDPSGSLVFHVPLGEIQPTVHPEPSVTSDAQGNVYIAGAFTELDLDGPLPNAGGQDIFVAKFDPAGNVMWARSFGGPGNDAATVRFDGAGGLVLGGWFVGSIDMDGVLTSNGGEDLLMARLDGDGEVVSARSFGTPGDDRLYRFAAAPTRTVFVTHVGAGALDFGDGPTTMKEGYRVVVAFDAADQLVYSKIHTSFPAAPTSFYFGAVELAADGSAFFAGSKEPSAFLNFGAGPLDGTIFAARLDPSGGHVWSLGVAPDVPFLSSVNGLSLGADGRLVIAGSTANGADLGEGPIGSGDAARVGFISMRDAADGSASWTRAFVQTAGEDLAHIDVGGAAVSPDGSVVVGGAFANTVDFGTGPLATGDAPQSYAFDGYLVRLAP